MSVSFKIPGKPGKWSRPANRRGGGRRNTDKHAAALEVVRHHATTAMRGRKPATTPTAVTIVAVYPRPSRRPSCVPVDLWQEGRRCPKATAPDADNVAKLYLDGIQGHVMADDRLVYHLIVVQQYAATDEEAHAWIEVSSW
jgi:Holliday junction resolvase RusA-like endonuclease